MAQSAFFGYTPKAETPPLFMRQLCGLDISDRSVEVVSLFRQGDDIQVRLVARTEIPSGLIQRGVVQDVGALGKVIGHFLDEHFGRRRNLSVAVAIPESLIFSKVCRIPDNTAPNLRLKALAIEVRDFMPISLERCHISALPLDSDGTGGREYLFFAVEKSAVDGYREALAAARVKVSFFDGEAVSLTRALARQVSGTTLLADIGARTTLLTLLDDGMRLTSNIMVGGDMLTAAVEQRLGVTLAEAEMIKQKAGFDSTAAEGRVMLILQKPMAEVVEEIRRTLVYHEKRRGRPVRQMVLAGGTSLLPAIVEYMKSSFPNMEIRRGDPFAGLPMDDFPDRPMAERTSILYSTALGLALRLVGAVTEPGLDIDHDERPESLLSLLAKKIFGNLTPQTMGKTTKKPARGKSLTARQADASSGKTAASQGGQENEAAATLAEGTVVAEAAPKTSPSSRKRSAAPPEPQAPPEPVVSQQNEAMIEGLSALSAGEDDLPVVPPAPEPPTVAEPVAPVVPPAPVVTPVSVAPPPAPAPEPTLLPASLQTETKPVDEEDNRPLPPTVPHELPAFVPQEAAPPAPAPAPVPAPVPAPAPPAVAEPEEKDYGLGIGDILASADNISPPMPTDDNVPAAGNPGVHRLKIDEILGRNQPEEAVPAFGGFPLADESPDRRPRRPRRRFPLVALLLLLAFAVVAALVFWFVQRNGLPFFGGSSTTGETATAPETGSAPELPTSLSLPVLLVTSGGQAAGEREAVVTRAVETDVEISGVYPATGKVPAQGAATSAVAATGTIKVVNNSGKPLTLIEKTRFQTADGKVFRMKQRVNVAVGETPVEVYADVPGAAGNIGPTSFTVPGLQGNATLYAQITGRSDEAMRGGSDARTGEDTVTAVDSADVVKAKQDLAVQLAAEAEENFAAMASSGEAMTSDLMSASDLAVEAPDAGTVGGDFKMKLSQRYRALLIPEAKIAELLAEKLASDLPEGTDPSAWTLGSPTYTVEAYDTKTDRAEVRVEAPLIRK